MKNGRSSAGLAKFERNLLVAFVLGFATICVLIGFSAHTVRVQEEHLVTVRAMSGRLELMDELLRRLLQAESSARAFALTGQPVFNQEYAVARDHMVGQISTLGRTRFDLADQGRRVQEAIALIQRRVARLDELVALRDSGDEGVREQVASGVGRALMDEIRTLFTAFAATQRQVIEDINREDLGLTRKLRSLLVAFGLLNVALMIASVVLVRHEWRRGGAAMGQLRDTMDEISLLNNLSSSLQSCGSVKEAKDTLQHFMERLFPDQSGSLYVVRASRGVLESKAAWGDTRDWESIMETGECWALRRGQLHEYFAGGDNLPCQHVRTPEAGGYVCVPMMAEGEGIGVLHLRDLGSAAATAAARAGLVERADRLAMQIGPAIASLTLREMLHQQSIRDGLTGLFNRRYLEETVGRELIRARRGRVPLAVIMSDVDHFKRFNDTHGHQAGDEALRAYAAFLQENVRGDDIACRYGGEEFAIVLPGASRDKAVERAERLRKGVMELQLRVRGELLPPVTASFGVALHPGDGDRWEDLLHAADGALYRAKREGRNCVAVASERDAGAGNDQRAAADPAAR